MSESTQTIDNLNADLSNLKVLVVIASFGSKNIGYLKRIIQSYLKMPLKVDVRVVSDAEKNLGPYVKVVVGLPTRNPWSLPFAHKAIFAEQVNNYDLFIYSEDDIEVTEMNLRAFVEVSAELKDDEIAGYLRYEVDATGVWSLPEVHGVHHWKPEAVRRRGRHLIAEFSNEHAAFYVLTQRQLRKAIASVGFLRAPHAGKYDMLCSAATDPYTSCGFRKVICFSSIDYFLIHHLPNRYSGKFGISLRDFREQINVLRQIAEGRRVPDSLGLINSEFANGRWAKSYYEPPDPRVLNSIPQQAKTVLIIGSGSGATEILLKHRGAEVTAFPMDCVIGSLVEQAGIRVLYGSLSEGLEQLRGLHFDCVLLPNLLHLFPEPQSVVAQCASVVQNGGKLLLSGPNFRRLPIVVKRLIGKGDYGKLSRFDYSGIRVFTVAQVSSWLRLSGLCPERPLWLRASRNSPVSGAHGTWEVFRRRLRNNWLQNGDSWFNAEGWMLVGERRVQRTS